MAYTSPAFSSAVSSQYVGDTATASTSSRHIMSRGVSRRLYKYRLDTYKQQDAHTEGSSQRSCTHGRGFTSRHPASHHEHSIPPRSHRGILLPEATASQHQATYLKYLQLVAAGKISDPTAPPTYDDCDKDEENTPPPQFPPPSYEQAVIDTTSQILEPRIQEGVTERRIGGMTLASHQTGRRATPARESTTRRNPTVQASTPAIQTLQLVQIDNLTVPTDLPLRRPTSKSYKLFSRVVERFRGLKGAEKFRGSK